MVPRYLRISVTARCNLACRYCTGESPKARRDLTRELPPERIGFLAHCAAVEGVRKIRLTGGEPLVRRDLEEIVREVSAVGLLAETTLTTNAIGLADRAGGLAAAGLARANISLDTLRRDRFAALTGRDLLEDVIAGIDAAAEAFEAVKLNTVLMQRVNGDEIEQLVRFAAGRGLRIRFIEQYGAGAAAADGEPDVQHVRQRLEAAFGELVPVAGNAISIERAFRLPSLGGASVGLIPSRSRPPCRTCAKLRFTADSRLRGCLFESGGEDISKALTARDEATVRGAIRRAFTAKKRAGGAHPWVGSSVRLVGG